MKQQLKIGLVGSSIILLGGIGFWKWKKQSQQEKAVTFYKQLERILDGAKGALQWEEAFDIEYANKMKDPKQGSLLVLKSEVAQKYANQIHTAWIPWYRGGDDEDKVYSVFRSLADKVQISQVAKAYQSQYGKHLIEVIKERFSKNEITMLLNIIKNKPSSSYV